METNAEFFTKFFYFKPLVYFYISPLTKQRRYSFMQQRKETFLAIQTLSLENSFTTLKTANVELEVIVSISSEDYGWFELYDVETGGDEWYAEGALQIENNAVTGYDGVFALPTVIIDKLKEWGYDTSEVE